jgi:pyruvate,water dikinase
MTPLFASWLLPNIEDGYLDGMQSSVGVLVPFRYAAVNGWYYNATPIPSPRLLAYVIGTGRSRAIKVLFNALIRVGRNPAAADRAVLADLHRQWRDVQLPRYRQLVTAAQAETAGTGPARLAAIVDQISREAGVYLWFLAIVGGSAWKMEARLTRFCRQHLPGPIEQAGGVQVLLRGLPGTQPATGAHAVHSVDWYHPLAGELPTAGTDPNATRRHQHLTARRTTAQAACLAALADRPTLMAEFTALLEVTQRYTVIREEQARDFTLGWPVLRACAHRLAQHLMVTGAITQVEDLFFCTRTELDTHLQAADGGVTLLDVVAERRERWQHQRRLAAPLSLGRPPRLVGDPIAGTVRAARGTGIVAEGAIVGHPASPGRATGPVRIVESPDDFADFRDGDILVAKATAPAWTPLFAHAAAVVTDGGTLAAHASLVAREYGIPAVVATGDATHRLSTGQLVTVDGTAGTVVPAANQR